MSNVNDLLNKRLNKNDSTSKMAEMARQTSKGELSSFSGVFGITELSKAEMNGLESLLKEHSLEISQRIDNDLDMLASITAEVKAISNQAAVLHGERIQKAHTILTKYKEGAFTAWLMATYGNRQTPYNYLRYYELIQLTPKQMRPLLESMPKQAVYNLAAREGKIDRKLEIVQKYHLLNKEEILRVIRELLPLDKEDKRKTDLGEEFLNLLLKVKAKLIQKGFKLGSKQKNIAVHLLEDLLMQIKN